ncbi:MAG: glycosyltransferase family 4 protein [Halioglobus sp.]|nr:glycosyltransferase family 4 protein [Halioglobus sp.]
MKILISAYSCETGRGGEGEIGWRMVNALAEQHEVRVITRANLRPVHEAIFSEAQKPGGLTFEYFDLPWIFRFYKKGNRFFLIYYYLWQIGVAFLARRMLRDDPADVLHHLIGGMDWMPSGLAFCRGPFVWGPVGSENTHPLMRRYQPLKTRMKDRIRVCMRGILRTYEPFTRYTGARADIVLSHTPDTMPRRYADKLRPFNQTGIADLPSLTRVKINIGRGERLRLVYAGDLKDWKGARMALEAALAFFETGADADLVVVGDGPLRADMEAATQAHPNGGQVRFLGKVSMERLIDELYEGDVFLYPTFHHGLATIVLQAMLTGLPIICVEGDATGRAVGQEVGITVLLSEDEAPSTGIVRAITELAEDESRRQILSHNARQIALERYSYMRLSRQIEAVYLVCIESKS